MFITSWIVQTDQKYQGSPCKASNFSGFICCLPSVKTKIYSTQSIFVWKVFTYLGKFQSINLYYSSGYYKLQYSSNTVVFFLECFNFHGTRPKPTNLQTGCTLISSNLISPGVLIPPHRAVAVSFISFQSSHSGQNYIDLAALKSDSFSRLHVGEHTISGLRCCVFPPSSSVEPRRMTVSILQFIIV